LVLGFVGAGGLGFQLLTAMSLFDYPTVSTLLVMIFLIVMGAERMSAWLRRRIA
jgi:phosphonate transport system permease protein